MRLNALPFFLIGLMLLPGCAKEPFVTDAVHFEQGNVPLRVEICSAGVTC